MSLKQTMHDLGDLLSGVARDLMKAARGNKSAAQRVRVGTLNISRIGKTFRKESVALENKSKRKHKKKKKR